VNETTVKRENVHATVIDVDNDMDNCASVLVQGMRFCKLSYFVKSSLVQFAGDKVRWGLVPFTDGTAMSDE